jgi:hypothetical protein
VYGDTLWASAAFAVASPDDTATAVASSSTEAAVSGDPWAGLIEDVLAAYRSLAADVMTVTRDQLPVYRSIPVVDVVQGVELELREVLRSARAGAPATCEAELARLALGQRLPARPHAAAVRHLVLERGHHPDDCSPAPRFLQMGHEQADVLGISWGGGLAQQFALSRPGRVRRLVLVATGTGALMVPGDPRVLLKMLTPRRHQDRGYAARIAGELYGGSARRDPAVARDLLHLTPRLGPARGYYYQLLSGIGWTSLPALAAPAAADTDPGRG